MHVRFHGGKLNPARIMFPVCPPNPLPRFARSPRSIQNSKRLAFTPPFQLDPTSNQNACISLLRKVAMCHAADVFLGGGVHSRRADVVFSVGGCRFLVVAVSAVGTGHDSGGEREKRERERASEREGASEEEYRDGPELVKFWGVSAVGTEHDASRDVTYG